MRGSPLAAVHAAPFGQVIDLGIAAGRGQVERGQSELGVGGDLRAVHDARVRPRST